MKIRDDLERRPSRVPVYQSTPHDLKDDSNSSVFSEVINQQYYAEALKDQQNLATSSRSHEFAASQDEKGAFCGPRMSAMRYPIPDITVPPDWEIYSPAGVCQWPQESDSFHSRSTDVSCILFITYGHDLTRHRMRLIIWGPLRARQRLAIHFL